jgi:arabinan endo-1,5-alpha-L-arabinosidase
LLLDDGVEKFSCHYEAELGRNGRSILDIRPLLWTPDDWPLPGENIRDGTYQIRSQRTGMVLQSSTNTVRTARYLVSATTRSGTSHPPVHGFYKISSVAATNALEAAEGTLGWTSFTGADNQLWKIDQLDDGSYRIASKLDKSALTAAFKIRPGNGVVLQPFDGNESQRWVITEP